MPDFLPPQFLHWNRGPEEVSYCWLLRQFFSINQIPDQSRCQTADFWYYFYHWILYHPPIHHKILAKSPIPCDNNFSDCWDFFYHPCPISYLSQNPSLYYHESADFLYWLYHWILSQSPIHLKIPAQYPIPLDKNIWLLRLIPSLNPCQISHLSQNPIPITHLLWSQNCLLLILLPSMNPCPISHLSKHPTPITHLLWSQNFWLLRLIPPMNPCPISHLSQIPSPIFRPLWSQKCLLLRLILSHFPNLPSIINFQSNISSPVVPKLIIVETDY